MQDKKRIEFVSSSLFHVESQGIKSLQKAPNISFIPSETEQKTSVGAYFCEMEKLFFFDYLTNNEYSLIVEFISKWLLNLFKG